MEKETNTIKLEHKDGIVLLNEKKYHLYFTNDDVIKEGDWYVVNNIRVQQPRRATEHDIGKIKPKVIATTDESLLVDFEGHEKYTGRECSAKVYLPQIPIQFIEEYVKAGGIDEVLLEYTNTSIISYKGENGTHKIPSKLKTDQNNCVIIHPIKPKLYTKEELITILEGFIEHPTKPGYKRRDIENWIKENLK